VLQSLQCVAVCCGVLRCVAVCCGVVLKSATSWGQSQNLSSAGKISQEVSAIVILHNTLSGELSFEKFYLFW